MDRDSVLLLADDFATGKPQLVRVHFDQQPTRAQQRAASKSKCVVC
jgi:hypothetical protein